MTTVFTNGCFDLLHVGHIRLLEFAARQGDRLIVGINSDASVRLNKGPLRPIIPERERVACVAALRCVDQVIVFDDQSVEPLIRQVRPDVLVKGPECQVLPVVGREFVESYGGRVVVPDWTVDISTSTIIERVRRDHRDRGSH